jgi:hypothetical protein
MDNNKELMYHSSIVDICGRHWINDLDERKGQSY